MGQQIIIRRSRMIITLTEEEVLAMLKRCPDVWEKSLRRGKGLLRYEKAMERIGK